MDPQPDITDTTDTVDEQRPPPRPLLAAAVIGATGVLAAAIWLAMHVHADMTLHRVAMFVHLAALSAGLGGVLTTDFQAVLWLLGRRTLNDVVRFAEGTHLLIWVGLAGLVASGILLRPDFSSMLTWVKMGLVLVVTINGIGVLVLQYRLRSVTTPKPSPRLLTRALVAGLISQLGWWGAVTIGFLNSTDASPTQAPVARAEQPQDETTPPATTPPTTPPAPTTPPRARPMAAPPTTSTPCSTGMMPDGR